MAFLLPPQRHGAAGDEAGGCWVALACSVLLVPPDNRSAPATLSPLLVAHMPLAPPVRAAWLVLLGAWVPAGPAVRPLGARPCGSRHHDERRGTAPGKLIVLCCEREETSAAAGPLLQGWHPALIACLSSPAGSWPASSCTACCLPSHAPCGLLFSCSASTSWWRGWRRCETCTAGSPPSPARSSAAAASPSRRGDGWLPLAAWRCG